MDPALGCHAHAQHEHAAPRTEFENRSGLSPEVLPKQLLHNESNSGHCIFRCPTGMKDGAHRILEEPRMDTNGHE